MQSRYVSLYLRCACKVLTMCSCTCGTQFCYACGKAWTGEHGCPYYGPAVYDDEGFNQEGYHRTTGRNRQGYTREEQVRVDRGQHEDSDDDEDNGSNDDNANDEDEDEDDDEDGEDDDDESHDEDGEDDDEISEDEEDHPALQFVDPDVRAAFAAMGRDERDMFLVVLEISLSEQQNLIFDNSNALTDDREADDRETDDRETDDRETAGGDDGDADSESDPSESDPSGSDPSDSDSDAGSQEGEDSDSLVLDVLYVDGDREVDTTVVVEFGDEDRLDVDWARPPGSWPFDEES